MLGLLAVTIAVVGFVNPGAAGVDGSSGNTVDNASHSSQSRGHRPLRGVIRIERNFEVGPHSLAINQFLRCPRRTLLTGGGTTLIGEPDSPADAPVVYTNGPVGDLVPGEQRSWASEVANTSGQTFTYRQFALCATRSVNGPHVVGPERVDQVLADRARPGA